ncbi:MAG: DUF1667 domain-containing protein [Hespellia sp.]|nr:DUF1667 domain-containing protein [Hespellia sp.]
MVKINLICIGCPMGCPLTIEKEGSNILRVTGNTCPRGDAYARKELTNPTRIVTSTVAVEGSDVVRVSVKTREDIPKDMIFACVKALKNVRLKAPVHIGDVVLENVAGTGVDVVATREVYSLSDPG